MSGRFTINPAGDITYNGPAPVTVSVRIGNLTAEVDADMSDEAWHRLLWLEMWRLLGVEVVRAHERLHGPIYHRLRGHQIYDDGDQWRYVTDEVPTAGNRRNCAECNKSDTIDGHDACLGTLPGVSNACCGHGEVDMAYIQWSDGSCTRGFDAALEQRRLVDEASHRAFMVWFGAISASGILGLLDDDEALRRSWLLMWRLIGQEERARMVG